MKKLCVLLIIFSVITITACGKDSGITVTGDNATITTNSENNNAQAIVDTDINPDIDITNDKSVYSTNNNTSDSSIIDSDEYKQLLNEKNNLQKENDEMRNQIEELQNQKDDIPIVEYNDIGLSINADDIPINKTNSMVTINGQEYFSKEIIEKLLSDNQNITIKDDTLFIGEVISEKVNLFDQWISDKQSGCDIVETKRDSYGNLYSNCLLLIHSNITFNTEGKYAFLKCDIAMSEGLYKDCTGVLTIKADDNIVYTAELSKLTKPYTELSIPINNCELLYISYDTDTAVSGNGCIISDAILYN